jgi:hypothetical protein
MSGYKAAALLLGFVPVLAFAGKKSKKPIVPALFNQAQYVYVQATDGSEFNPNLLPEDEQAIADVQQAIQRWGRYILTVDRSDADLVFVVRTGRLLTGRGNVGIIRGGPFPGQGGNGTVVGGGGEVGPPDDLLWVCTLDTDGQLATPLWQRTEADGLAHPDVPLFMEFERAVDQAYPRTTAKKAKKP